MRPNAHRTQSGHGFVVVKRIYTPGQEVTWVPFASTFRPSISDCREAFAEMNDGATPEALRANGEFVFIVHANLRFVVPQVKPGVYDVRDKTAYPDGFAIKPVDYDSGLILPGPDGRIPATDRAIARRIKRNLLP